MDNCSKNLNCVGFSYHKDNIVPIVAYSKNYKYLKDKKLDFKNKSIEDSKNLIKNIIKKDLNKWTTFIKKSIDKKKTSIKSFFWVGGISGISSVFIGATGPLIAPFFLNYQLTKENIIANKAACQVISHLGKIPLFIYFFNVNYINESQVLLPLIIAVFLGTNFGKKVLEFIPEALFKKLFRYTLLIIAIRLIVNDLF